MIKEDELQLIRLILTKCNQVSDMIPTDEILKMGIPFNRLMYLLKKLNGRGLLDCGVSARYSWLAKTPAEIKEYYKKTHGVDL